VACVGGVCTAQSVGCDLLQVGSRELLLLKALAGLEENGGAATQEKPR
jgi:hypothetical protein